MAVHDYIPSTPGTWPGSSADALYINFLKLTYADEMILRMQQLTPKVASRAGRQIELTGYETRIDRWSKATLQQRQRGAMIGANVANLVNPYGGTVTVGVASAETGTQNFVIRGVPWEYPEYFDVRDAMGLKARTAALTDGAYKENVLGAMARKWDSTFLVALDATAELGVENGGTVTYSADGGTDVAGTLIDTGLSSVAFVTSFHHAKAIKLLQALQTNDAFEGPSENFLALHPIQLAQVFTDSQKLLTGADYNAARPLMEGQVGQYLGMTWLVSTEVPAQADIDATTGTQAGHYVYAWNRKAMVTGRGQIVSRVDYVADRTSDLVYQGAYVGATRTDGTGVARVACIDLFDFS